MIWKNEPPPRILETTVKTKFAWLPVEIDGGRTIWLCKYKEKLRYEDGGYFDYESENHTFNQRIQPACYGTFIYGPAWVSKSKCLLHEELRSSKWDNWNSNTK